MNGMLNFEVGLEILLVSGVLSHSMLMELAGTCLATLLSLPRASASISRWMWNCPGPREGASCSLMSSSSARLVYNHPKEQLPEPS